MLRAVYRSYSYGKNKTLSHVVCMRSQSLPCSALHSFSADACSQLMRSAGVRCAAAGLAHEEWQRCGQRQKRSPLAPALD
eukprot:3007702-Rhodomonas_salina.1